jgi:superfamily II DNA or RNA helicase
MIMRRRGLENDRLPCEVLALTQACIHRPGDWIWNVKSREPVKVIEVIELWEKGVYRVWSPSRDAVIQLQEDELSPITQADIPSSERLLYAVSGARIEESLAHLDIPIAPVEARVVPLPHQIHAVSRAILSDRVRYLLADEVGLGKTIEAGLIMREMKIRGLVRRTLVVAPKGLVMQWAQEMENRFYERFHVVEPSEITTLSQFDRETNLWRRFDQVIVPMDAVKPLESRRGWGKEQVERYNQERFEKLVAAGWDLVIVDEAHRVAGSSGMVARHRLGQGLAQASPYFLLLTATPHQGKTESFHRLMSLLDKEAFPNVDSIKKERVAPFVIRTEKCRAIDEKGRPLFKPRRTQLVPVAWKTQHKKQRMLYEAVTEYVREGYNLALKEKRNYVGFLMVLMQRLVASSTKAIRTALERRLQVIEEEAPNHFISLENLEEDWWDTDGQDQLEEVLKYRLVGFANEREQVKRLLSLAWECEFQSDARAEALLEWIYRLQAEENDPELKFLIFTEFTATQEMIKEFLEDRGFSAVCLNGSMSLEERRRVQQEFSSKARILVSTDAGGEGLNLQFCHVILNYDLPWNPMRIEQRIGRVDRIGQEHTVRALNFVLENTIEHRVQEVLQEKLAAILADFGVDKMSDVLDSAEVASDFEGLYKEAILSPEELEPKVQELESELRERFREATTTNRLLTGEAELNTWLVERISTHPLPYWTERMLVNYVLSAGGRVEPRLAGYDLTWPEGLAMKGVSFSREEADRHSLSYLSLGEPRVRELLSRLPFVVPGQPIPKIRLRKLQQEIRGYWSLWRIAIFAENARETRIMPMFEQEGDGKMFIPTAQRIWDLLLEQPSVDIEGYVPCEETVEVYNRLKGDADRYGYDLFRELESQHEERLQEEREKAQYWFQSRRDAILKIGLPTVREHRLAELSREEENWFLQHKEKETILPGLSAITIVHIEGDRQ